MLSRSTHAHQIWSDVVLTETHRRNVLSGSEVIIADTHMKKPVLDESRARPREMTADANFISSEVLRPEAYRRNLLCMTLENVLEKCLWRSEPLSFSMHADIPNSNRCTGRGARRPRAHRAPRAGKSGLAPWTRINYPRQCSRCRQCSGSSPSRCPAVLALSAVFWVKPVTLPDKPRA